jgi:hypothetical protein
MRLVPKAKADKIQFFQSRLPKWIENAEALGIDPAVLEELQAVTDAARAAYVESRQAKQRAQSATTRMDQLLEQMGRLGAGVVQGVRVNARRTGGGGGGGGVYPLASIPAPRKRSRLAPPGMPHRFAQALGNDGAVTLTWQCEQPRGAVGTMYSIERRDGVNGPFRFLAAVGERKFRDATIPPGTPAVVYRVQAARGKSKGPVALHTVSFGGGIPDRFATRTKKVCAVAPPGARNAA